MAPTVGVTGTKGKTTTASLIAAILGADREHPVVLGGNIGVPILDRLAEITPEHRVVYELSELQLPTLSRGTTLAVYTNVTSDHLDRHGSLEAYRRAKRILAERVDPDGALVLNADDPVVASYAELGTARAVCYRHGEPGSGEIGVARGWIAARGVATLVGGASIDGRLLPVDELLDFVRNSEIQIMFRSYLFTRIVPTLRDIGLWGPRIQKAFGDMGVLGFADADLEAVMAGDERTAEELDALRRGGIEAVAAVGASD